jgi:cation diffusion facilitator family transporter
MSKKTRVASLSIASNTLLIILKVIAGIVSGSVSVISEAIHSGLDLLAAIIAYFSVRISDLPPDERHPYGHGKFENVSGVIEALLIFIAAIWISYEAIEKLINRKEVEQVGIGIVVMLIAAVVNIIVSRNLYKVAKATDSVALEADALHLKTDVYTSIGVALGLSLIWLTGWHLLDPIFALIVVLIILKESFELLRKAFLPLLDETLPSDDLIKLKSVIDEHCINGIKYHHLRTRKAGNYKFIDFHLEVPEDISVKTAHKICDVIEDSIKLKFKYTEVNIHVETLPDQSSKQFMTLDKRH